MQALMTSDYGTGDSSLLPDKLKELHIVITEGRPELAEYAANLKPQLDRVTDGRSTLIETVTALDALRVIRNYGFVPLVQVIGDTRQDGQATLALAALHSQKAYLCGFYKRRRAVEQALGLLLHEEATGSGRTFYALMGGFWVAIILSLLFLCLLPFGQRRPLLQCARLSGADLTAVVGLTQEQLAGACGDASTKLPRRLALRQCQ